MNTWAIMESGLRATLDELVAASVLSVAGTIIVGLVLIVILAWWFSGGGDA